MFSRITSNGLFIKGELKSVSITNVSGRLGHFSDSAALQPHRECFFLSPKVSFLARFDDIYEGAPGFGKFQNIKFSEFLMVFRGSRNVISFQEVTTAVLGASPFG